MDKKFFYIRLNQNHNIGHQDIHIQLDLSMVLIDCLKFDIQRRSNCSFLGIFAANIIQNNLVVYNSLNLSLKLDFILQLFYKRNNNYG